MRSASPARSATRSSSWTAASWSSRATRKRSSTTPARSARRSSSAWSWSVSCAFRRSGRRKEQLGGAAGHRREDYDRVAVLDARLEAVEDADVLVVQVDVDVAVQLALGVEQLGRGFRVRGGQGTQHLTDVGARGVDLGGAAGFRAQDWR